MNSKPSSVPLIGLPAIDLEHGLLMDSLRRLHQAPLDEVRSEPFLEVISRLGLQIIEHFGNEEKVLSACGMSIADVESHLRAHNAILEQYTQLQDDLMNSKDLEQSSILSMIQHWIMTHVAVHDVKITQHITG